MNARIAKKIMRSGQMERIRAYGSVRSTGSKKLRRGRKGVLRTFPLLRDWSSLPIAQKISLLEAYLDYMERDSRLYTLKLRLGMA